MIEKLSQVIKSDRIRENVPMSTMTTFKTGGNADIIVFPHNVEELKAVVKLFYDMNTPYYVLGNGSNLLVSDDGLRNPVICLGRDFASIDLFDNCITARSGAFLSTIAKKARDNSLTGFEFAAGIPGSFGGALIMNAGAYGGEMKDVVEAVSFLDPSGEEHVVSCDEMEFSYRKSALSDTNFIVTGATIKLEQGNMQEIDEKMAELAAKRREKQPIELPSAGSTFKRPTGYFAGTLIEQSGLKGRAIGGAMVSEKHAGFIVNTGGATTKDICDLIQLVQDIVYEKHGVLLETEVKFWE